MNCVNTLFQVHPILYDKGKKEKEREREEKNKKREKKIYLGMRYVWVQFHLLLTPSLPCHLKTTIKSAKCEALKPFCFLFCTDMWKGFHQKNTALKEDVL